MVRSGFQEVRRFERGAAGPLECLLTWPARGEPRAGIVVFSPSPLLGGDMENNVTEALAHGAAARGFAALRVNYRNVGRSGGDTGGLPRFEWWHALRESGDFTPALEDARTALAAAAREFEVVALTGYSFGAWIAASLVDDGATLRIGAVAPPLRHHDFRVLESTAVQGVLVVAGSDQLDPPPPAAEIRARFPHLAVHVVADADHFLLDRETEAADPVLDALLLEESA